MIGYDYYQEDIIDSIAFLQYCKQKKILLYHFQKQSEVTYLFYCPIYQRYILRKLGYLPIKSIGILHYLLLLIGNVKNIMGIIFFISTVLFCTNFLFEIQITGNNQNMNKLVFNVLEEMDIHVGVRVQSYQEMITLYDLLKNALKQEIDYLNIHQTGSILNISYTPATNATETKLGFENIIASKDGIIQRIEVEDGNVLVTVNDYVKKGDILVSNTIVSTSGKTKMIPVAGKVYAYTYQRISLSMEPTNNEAEDFSNLLLQARNSLTGIDKIDKEIVLEYAIINEKRVLEVQYVCIENIGVTGEKNEKNN